MHEINLQEAKISYDGEWLSVEEISHKIKQKIDAGDMKFAGLASALETLNLALENAHTLFVRIVLERSDYNLLKAVGGNDTRECIAKAIQWFIGGDGPADGNKGRKKGRIRCAGCNQPIEVSLDQENDEITCTHCGARGLLKPRQQKGQNTTE